MKKKDIVSLITGIIIFLLLAVLSVQLESIGRKSDKKYTIDDGKTIEDYIIKEIRKGKIRSADAQLEFYIESYPEKKEKTEELRKEIEKKRTEIIREYEEVLKRTEIIWDEVEERTYLYPKIYDFSWKQNIITMYLEDYDKKIKMRFIVRYHGDDEIDFEKVVLNIDGKKREITFKDLYSNYDYDSNTEKILGYDHTKQERLDDFTITEWVNVKMKNKYLHILKEIASSEKTLIRISGSNRQVDRIVTEEEKQAVRDMIIIYNYTKNVK